MNGTNKLLTSLKNAPLKLWRSRKKTERSRPAIRNKKSYGPKT